MSKTPSARILVVDDESYVRDSLAETLEADGHQVDTCGAVAAALQKLDTTDFDRF